jgi:hypothetical protein
VVDNITAARTALISAGVSVQEVDLNLDEIFEAYVIGKKENKPQITQITQIQNATS